jgi:hypothetical protein
LIEAAITDIEAVATDTPARLRENGINEFGSGLSLVHFAPHLFMTKHFVTHKT